MLANIIFNLIFLIDLGGIIALVLYALARWPVLVKRADTLLGLAACLIPLVLIAGFVVTHVFGPSRGVNTHGCHYEDVWRDD